MLTWIEEETLRALGRGVPAGSRLGVRATADPRSRELAAFCRRLAELAPHIAVAPEEAEESADALPAIVLPNGVRWCGVPHGTELEPFIEALAGRTGPPPEGLAAVTLPAVLEVYVTAHCPFCPETVRRLMPFAGAGGRIRLAVIDGGFFTEAAERAGVRAAPTVVLDGTFRWTGTVPLAELRRLLVERDALSLGPASLEMMLKAGGARRLAQMMAAKGALVPALIELLCHDRWPVRLGAMVALEELAALDAGLAAEALERLWQRYGTAPETLKGDILFLIGEVGARGFLARVQSAAAEAASAEVREAAGEAAQKLAGPPGSE
jgi:glutaredoxin